MAIKRIACAIILIVACCFSNSHSYEALTGPTGVLFWDQSKTYNGYTLYSPIIKCTETYLIDMEGNVVHKWKSKYRPGLHAELLPNGNLLRAGQITQEPGFCTIGGVGGIIEEIDWNGNVVWEYRLFEPGKAIQHHTFKRMPNGNTLVLAWEAKSKKEAIAKGRDPKTIPDKPVKFRGVDHSDFWVDFVREVDKAGKTVWEWHAWDHIGKGKDKLDINFKLPHPVGHGLLYPDLDWSHFNSVDYDPKTDQVILNSRHLSEVYFINHKTGKIEARWGNPTAYDPKAKKPGWYDNGDQIIFGSHCASLLENGNILLFDNGSERPENQRSAALEFDPKTGKIVWLYEANHSPSFLSYRQGAVQRLPNGNTLVTSSMAGHVFEVTPDKQVVWDYVCPVFGGEAKCVVTDNKDAFPPDRQGMQNMIHRAYRYGPDFPGLVGKDLSKKTPLADCPLFYKVWKKGAFSAPPEAVKSGDKKTDKKSGEEEPEAMPGY